MGKKTPLYDLHVDLGGKIVDFAGWDLAVRYSSVVEEHLAVRSAAGLFDVSHMGEIFVEGDQAEEFLEYVACNKLASIYDGKAQYSALLNEQGGVIDDIIIYRFNSKKFLVCVNASNADKDYEFLLKQNKFNTQIINRSSEYAQIALQGPLAEKILSAVLKKNINLKYFHFEELDYAGFACILARTGYTGEDGFEIFCDPKIVRRLAEEILETGKPYGLLPCGLGARDSLRLEAAYPLHGHELSEDLPALYSGLAWIIKFSKTNFIGKTALEDLQHHGLEKKLVGLQVIDPGVVRENVELYVGDIVVGKTTSGTLTPSLNKAIALAIVDYDVSKVGNILDAQVRGRRIKCQIINLPFYKRS